MGKIQHKKLKISKVKRNNQKRNKLTKQGKLKFRRHKPPQKQNQKVVKQPLPIDEEESDNGEDMLNMVEEDDLKFLEKSISNKSYDLLKQIRMNQTGRQSKRNGSKRKLESDDLEQCYEKSISQFTEEDDKNKVRMLLPVKTQNGFIESRTIVEDNLEEDLKGTDNESNEMENEEIDESKSLDENFEVDQKPVSTIELLACREEVLKSKKYQIGLLSSSILESPEHKCGNLRKLLEFMDEKNPEIYITVRKLATVSLLEVFKDILPSYNILHIKPEGVRFKKETLNLQNYEATLLNCYKNYLQRLEKMSNVLRRKRGDNRVIPKPEIDLGELAIKCMCELLVTHVYFNFSTNIVNFLVPLLDSNIPSVRGEIAKCITQIFKEDKRGEISLAIIQRLNRYIKLKSHCVHTELLSVLLHLRIKEINLDKEKEEESKQKKLMSHKQRILSLSRNERKRNKNLEKLETELLETKAEENKQKKHKVFTEITSIVFTIYFRILKQASNNKILSVCLEGLAKFAHCINLEFYQDLVVVINKLIEDDNLGLKEQLHSIQCVFAILSGPGVLINVDPYRFYALLYKNLLNIHIGQTQAETSVVIKLLVQILIHRRKQITQARLVAFVKRISTMALQLQHNGALGILGVVKQIMQLGKAANILLDTDSSVGSGFYQPELEDPEYCNAQSTALWELTALQRHYHSVVQKMSQNIASGVPTIGERTLTLDIAKLTPEELYTEFDPSGVAFKPAIPVPKKVKLKESSLNHPLVNRKLAQYIDKIQNTALPHDINIDFHKEIESN